MLFSNNGSIGSRNNNKNSTAPMKNSPSLYGVIEIRSIEKKSGTFSGFVSFRFVLISLPNGFCDMDQKFPEKKKCVPIHNRYQ